MRTIKNFNSLGCGRLKKSYPNNSLTHTRILGCYALVLLRQGKGVFYGASSEKYQLHAGDVFMLFPGVPHRYGPLEGDRWLEYWCMFDGLYARSAQSEHIFTPRSPIVAHHFSEELSKLWRKASKNLESDRDVFLKLFDRLVEMNISPHIDGQQLPQALIKTISILDQESEKSPVSYEIRMLLEKSGYHYDYVRSLFREKLATTPLAYLQSKVIERAEKMLREERLVLSKIAHILGYEDVYYFSRLFKKKNGLAPGQYRAQFSHFQ